MQAILQPDLLRELALALLLASLSLQLRLSQGQPAHAKRAIFQGAIHASDELP
jgi:hypothetical protein